MKLSEYEKEEIENQWQPLIKKLKARYVEGGGNKDFNYLVDIYLKWNRGFLYLNGTYESEAGRFETKYVRLKVIGKEKFDFSYFRHTGKWFLVATHLNLKECLVMITENPNFHPI